MTVHPLDLSEYGKRPDGGGDVFRIVLAESRTDALVFQGKSYEVPRYPNVKGWVLEKWIDPETYFGNISREEFQKQAESLEVKSDYYANGDYESSRMLGERVDPAVVRDWIERVIFQRNHLTEEERRALLMAKAEREQKQRVQNIHDTIDTALKG
jgi:hypothetical protein